ncbi:MAG: hypothetical protein CM15mP122_2720 [Bacteroidota bacterium]|nr:MAG: hypothetical protein CM15mP122_2720 [Bacteroidota bacterium]
MMEHPQKFNTILENWLRLEISENMQVKSSRFIISNTDVEMCPKMISRIRFHGRSNVVSHR